MKTVLTERQEQIVKLICEGLTCKEIGQRLGLAENTIANHQFIIKEKLKNSQGVEGRMGIVCWAIATGVYLIPNVSRMYRTHKPDYCREI